MALSFALVLSNWAVISVPLTPQAHPPGVCTATFDGMLAGLSPMRIPRWHTRPALWSIGPLVVRARPRGRVGYLHNPSSHI